MKETGVGAHEALSTIGAFFGADTILVQIELRVHHHVRVPCRGIQATRLAPLDQFCSIKKCVTADPSCHSQCTSQLSTIGQESTCFLAASTEATAPDGSTLRAREINTRGVAVCALDKASSKELLATVNR